MITSARIRYEIDCDYTENNPLMKSRYDDDFFRDFTSQNGSLNSNDHSIQSMANKFLKSSFFRAKWQMVKVDFNSPESKRESN